MCFLDGLRRSLASARSVFLWENGVARLADVTVDVGAGECVVVTGSPDGGRRALLRLLATLDRPSSGSVLIGGVDAGTHPGEARKHVALVTRDALAGERLTAGEYLRLTTPQPLPPPPAGHDSGSRARERQASPPPGTRFLRAAQVGEDARIDRLPANAQTVVALAGACARRDGLLLIDLPDGVLDAATRAALTACVEDALQRGAAVVISTDDEDAVAGVCTHGMRLEGGRIVAEWRVPERMTPGQGKPGVDENTTAIARHVPGHAGLLGLVRRELLVTGRTGAFWAAVLAHVLVLAAFVLVWGDGLPVQGSGTAFGQFAALESMVLAVMLPWVAVRCGVPEERDRLVLLAISTGTSLRRVVLAKCAGQSVALALVVATALPLWMVMRQVSALSIGDLGASMIALVALAPAAAVLGTLAAIALRSRILGWVVVAALLVVLS